jgi:hypothetical protein
MSWQKIVGKVFPWLVGGVAIIFEITGVVPSWWPTVLAFGTGLVQLIISTIP